MIYALLVAMSLQLSTPRQQVVCEDRAHVEIFVVEDMVDGPEMEAPFRVIETIRGRSVETLVLKQRVDSRGFLQWPNDLSKGTVRLVFVDDDTILREEGCSWKTQGNRRGDMFRFPAAPGRRDDWRDDAFEMGVRFARAYVRFEREPTAQLLIEMLTSDDLPLVRAGMQLLRRVVHANPPEAMEGIGSAIVSTILGQLPVTGEGRVYLLETPGVIGMLLSHVSRRRREGIDPPSWADGLVEIYLRLEQGQDGRLERMHPGAVCQNLLEIGAVERCDLRSPERGLFSADRQRLMDRFDIEVEAGQPRRELPTKGNPR